MGWWEYLKRSLDAIATIDEMPIETNWRQTVELAKRVEALEQRAAAADGTSSPTGGAA